jgi:hypothetical protein
MVRLIETNFLNEERFAKAFAGGKFRTKKWGRLKIKRELAARKISDYCIKAAMKEIDEKDYWECLVQLIEKKSALKASLQLHAPESQESRQIVKKWFRILHESIDGSLPFEMSERKKKVLELEKRWQDGEPTITTLWSLWTLSHEELSLTRGVHYSLLKDNATEKEKEVVRLGMWRMYERDIKNYTLIEMKNQKWVRNPISKANDRASAEKLFEASQNKNFQRILFLPQGDSK